MIILPDREASSTFSFFVIKANSATTFLSSFFLLNGLLLNGCGSRMEILESVLGENPLLIGVICAIEHSLPPQF